MHFFLLSLLLAVFTSTSRAQVNLGPDTVICSGNSYTLDAGNSGSSYAWSTDENTQKISIHHSGTYSVTVTDSTGKQSTGQVQVVFLNDQYHEADNWLFGNGGHLDFKPLPDSLPFSGNFQGGSSSISDSVGNLLFYTNGGVIYDRNGNMMQNGNNIAGDPSAAANSIIVPSPGSAVYYFVFTLYPGIGLYYSEVNSQGNGNLGSVIVKNQLLDEYAGDFTAVENNAGSLTWLIVHNNNSSAFTAYPVMHDQIGNPITSNTGPVVTSTNQMKVSVYGDKVAMTDGSKVYLYRFDNNKGTLKYQNSVDLAGAKGVGFSRGNNNLFVSTASGGIYSIDVTPIPDTLRPKQVYQSPNNTPFSDLQLAKDNGIYVADSGSNCLGKIVNADSNQPQFIAKGKCLPNGATVGSTLPPFPQHFFKYPPGLGLRWNDTCQNFPVTISGNYYLDQFPFAKVSYQLDLGDGTVLDTNYTIHSYKHKGNFTITFTAYSVCPAIVRQQVIHIDSTPVFTPLPDTTLCKGQQIVLDPKPPNNNLIIWSTGDTSNTLTVDSTGNYRMNIFGAYCIGRDTAHIQIIPSPQPGLKPSDWLCMEKHETLTLTAKDGVIYYWWPSGDTTASITISDSGLYVVEATSADNCTTYDSTHIDNICDALLLVPDVFSPNGDFVNDVFLPKGKWIQAYELRIYDRWGELIFVSKQLDEGWNGYYRGRLCETGAYGYVIFYQSKTHYPQNETLTKKGNLLLVH